MAVQAVRTMARLAEPAMTLDGFNTHTTQEMVNVSTTKSVLFSLKRGKWENQV